MLSRNWIVVAASLLIGLLTVPTLHAQQCRLDLGGTPGMFAGNKAQTGQATDASVKANCLAASSIVIATGNKIEQETDFASRGDMGLTLHRTYSNYWDGIGIFGKNWLSNFDYKLEFNTTSTTGTCYPKPGVNCATPPTSVTTFWALRPDGRQVEYDYNATQAVWWENKASPISKIVRNADGTYTLTSENHSVEKYSSRGYVLSVANEQGIGWTFSYDASNYLQRVTHTSGRYVQLTWTGNQLTSVTDPQGNQFNYTYLANRFGTGLNLLSTATLLPGVSTSTVAYYYEDTRFLGALTGKAYFNVRYSHIAYDSAGRAISSYHGNVTGTHYDEYSFTYTPGSGNSLTVVESLPILGRTTTYQFVNGLLQSVTGTGGSNAAATYKEHTYDANGYDDLVADFNGNITNYDYAANGQLQKKVEAYNTPAARTTTYVWDADPTRNRPIKITVVGVRETSLTYDSLARIASVTVKNLSANGVANQTHTTTYTYTTYTSGITKSIKVDGPLLGTGDAVTSNFSSSGDLTSVVNSLGQTVTYSTYNGLGEPGHVVGVNGAATDYTYDAQGRVINVRTYPNGVAANVAYGYESTSGLLLSIGTPDRDVHYYGYDITRRLDQTRSLTGGTVTGGSTVQVEDYSLDNYGDVIGTTDSTQATAVTRSTTTSYDALSRLLAVQGNNSQNFVTHYDLNDNPTTAIDSLNHTTTLTYDAFNRVIKSVDAKGGITLYAYDTAGNLIKVTDPRGLNTTYVYDGFGQLWAQSSPDSGTTSFTYNAYGQLTAMTRANGQGTGYGYDSLGRLAAISAGGQTQTVTYDTCTNGKGQICQVTDPSGQLNYTYTPEGRVLTQTQVIGTDPLSIVTGYSYDAMGHVTGISYPSGTSVGYGYIDGVITTMTATINGVTTTLAGGIQYQPFGPATNWTYGNSLTRSLSYDLDGRPAAIATADGATNLQSLGYGFDANNSITGITNSTNTAQTQSYAYDELIRLTGVTSTGGNWTYALDPTNNRTSQSGPLGAVSLTVDTASNRLTGTAGASVRSFGYDVNGNRIADTGANGTLGFAYDPFNRMQSATNNGVTTNYLVNAFGQRVRKDQGSAATTTGYVYGGGNTMLGEYSWSGSGWTSYLWLGGQLVGVVRNNTLYYVHSDHLGRPEIVTDAGKNIVWRANNYAFDRTVTLDTIGGLNLGFPGQYYDAETGLWNNGFRDYDASVGRYVESDPIGLMGGINPFAYVGGNPVAYFDPLGLKWTDNWWVQDLVDIHAGISGFLAGFGVTGVIAGGSFGTATPGALAAGGITTVVVTVGQKRLDTWEINQFESAWDKWFDPPKKPAPAPAPAGSGSSSGGGSGDSSDGGYHGDGGGSAPMSDNSGVGSYPPAKVGPCYPCGPDHK